MICKCLIICNIYFIAPRPYVTKLNPKEPIKMYNIVVELELAVDVTYYAAKTFVNYLLICAEILVVSDDIKNFSLTIKN